MDIIYSKYMNPIQPEKKQSSSPNSQVAFNNIQQYLDDYSPSNRKLSFSVYRSQELKDSQQLSNQNKLSQDFQSESVNSQVKIIHFILIIDQKRINQY